jgi:hypothetical protein
MADSITYKDKNGNVVTGKLPETGKQPVIHDPNNRLGRFDN